MNPHPCPLSGREKDGVRGGKKFKKEEKGSNESIK